MIRNSPNGLRVIHVAETIRGGIATYLREIIALQIERYDDGWVGAIIPREQIADLGELKGVRLFPIETAKSRIGTAWRARRQLKAILKKMDVDVVHVHSTFAGISCRLPGRGARRKTRFIYCPHGWAFSRAGARTSLLARFVERVLSYRCDGIVCVSGDEFSSALNAGLPSTKLKLIKNGLPDRRHVAGVEVPLWADEALRLLFVGRLDRQKGFDVLIDAVGRLSRKVEVRVFGAAVLEGEYADQAPLWMHMHGWQGFEVIEPYLVDCDLLVMPSRWEGLPLTALEAMRAGRAIVASNVGGLAETVDDGTSGYLVPPDDPEMLASILATVDRESLNEMGKQGRKKFLREFLISNCERELASMYHG